MTTNSALLSTTLVPLLFSQGLSSTAVAEIVVGAIVVLTLLDALFIYISRKRSSSLDKDNTTIPFIATL